MDNELEYLLDSVGLSWRETEISQLIFQHKWHDAAQKLEERLEAAPFDPGLLISAAFVYEKKQQVQRASELYDDALLFVRREHQHRLMKEKADLFKKMVRRPKIIFFVKPDLDRFLNAVVEHLSETYRTRKIAVHDLNQIDTGMQWADICWFEWCDDLLIHGSKVPSAAAKTLICRLHSYEAFTFYIKKVYWQAVDQVIFDGEHMREYVLDQVKSLKKEKTAVVPNGIKLDEYTFQQRQKGFHIAYVGYINYKKGPMLLLQAFKALIDKDPRYKLFIAGTFQDARYQLYFKQMIDELRLTDNVQFDGWQDDMNQYLEDKHYLICTSLLESQHMSAMEAMAKGIKPLIHNFYGAKTIYDESVVWNTIDEFVAMITSGDYTSLHYRFVY
ncbi:glycosyltransferase family 4 protein [Bacillus paralicheniformis]